MNAVANTNTTSGCFGAHRYLFIQAFSSRADPHAIPPRRWLGPGGNDSEEQGFSLTPDRLKEAPMLKQPMLVSVTLAALVSPAAATEFYIVQDTATKRCRIEQQKPTSITMVVVVEDKIFTTRVDAENSMRSVEACKTGETDAAGPTLQQPK
jgi:hypothetical protein